VAVLPCCGRRRGGRHGGDEHAEDCRACELNNVGGEYVFSHNL
jgi:hypothetical protein